MNKIELSRRNFLKISGLGLAYYATYLGSSRATRLVLDTQLSHYAQETATAVEAVRKNTSFIPEGPFDWDFFNNVQKGTYVLDIYTKKDIWSGTGWCAEKEDDMAYIATGRHVAVNKKSPEEVPLLAIWRPNVDQRFLVPQILAIATYDFKKGEQDMAVIKIRIPPEEKFNQVGMEVLNFEDTTTLPDDTSGLVVGFPGEFKEVPAAADGLSYLTAGSVVNIKDEGDSNWSAESMPAYGLSGSPLVIPDNDRQPLVVGMSLGHQNRFSINKPKLSTPEMRGVFLEIKPLIEVLKKHPETDPIPKVIYI